MNFFSFLSFFILSIPGFSQTKPGWKNVDSSFAPLPPSVHVFYTEDKIDTSSFRAFYLIADLKDKNLHFTTDTTFRRRMTPSQFYEKNNNPLVVVNGTFFSFATNENLNVVMKDGIMLADNLKVIKGYKKDTINEYYIFRSAIGIDKKRNADVAWTNTDSATGKVTASQKVISPKLPPIVCCDLSEKQAKKVIREQTKYLKDFHRWQMQTAIGGGPVLIQDKQISITNEEEVRFQGKGIRDKHPRTAMGYTNDNKLIILVVEGRNPDAGGATLIQEAEILKDLGCVEALNLDGGGSSCLLINGKETIKPSDKVQRAVPAVFIIRKL
jgi:hypothetical protein